MRWFNYNRPYKLTKHLKGSPRLKYIFFLCCLHKIQQCNPEESSTVLLWSLFLWIKAGEQNQHSNKGPSPETPETEVHRRYAEKELLIQVHFQILTTCGLNLSSQENTTTYRCLLGQNEHIHAIVASLTVVLLFINVSKHLNYKVISQFKASA